MIEASPGLVRPVYNPTLRASTANFALATLRSRVGALRRAVEPPLGRTLQCAHPDVSVEIAKDSVAYQLPSDAPVVIFLPTITGTAAQTRWLMRYASTRGWQSCTFVRRGQGDGRLSSPSFNLLGAVDDVEMQMDAVRKAFPDAPFLAMVGVSAGSGLLISYLGRSGASTPIGAACSICPAWDVQAAFSSLSTELPVAERAMVRQMKRTFVEPNEKLLRAWMPQAYDACVSATSLLELLGAHAPFAMRDAEATLDDYFLAHDPMADRKGIAVPTLVLNAEDDFVCPAALARPDVIVNEQSGALLLVTKSGSHVAFNEGRWGRGSFHMRLSFDFLDAAYQTRARESVARPKRREAALVGS